MASFTPAAAYGPRDRQFHQGRKQDPLVEAIKRENLDEVKSLIKRGVNLKKEYEFRYGRAPALHLAAAINNRTDIVQFFLSQRHFTVRDKTTSEQMTALHWAARCNPSKDITKYLLREGADPNQKDVNGLTALHHAAEKSLLGDIVKWLVLENADVNAQDKKGQTALMYATQRKSINRHVMRVLLKNRANVNLVDKKARTVLHHAVRSKKGDNVSEFVVEQLLDHGMDVNLPDKDGWTSLHHATLRSDTKQTKWLLSLLLKHEAQPNAKERSGLTPLHNAARVATDGVAIAMLLKAGAELNAQDRDDYTPLHYAAYQNASVEVLQALLDARADVKLTLRGSQETALHLACLQDVDEAVKLDKVQRLLAAGVDPMSVDCDGLRASQYPNLSQRVQDCIRSAESAGKAKRRRGSSSSHRRPHNNMLEAPPQLPSIQHFPSDPGNKIADSRAESSKRLYSFIEALPREWKAALPMLDAEYRRDPENQAFAAPSPGWQHWLNWLSLRRSAHVPHFNRDLVLLAEQSARETAEAHLNARSLDFDLEAARQALLVNVCALPAPEAKKLDSQSCSCEQKSPCKLVRALLGFSQSLGQQLGRVGQVKRLRPYFVPHGSLQEGSRVGPVDHVDVLLRFAELNEGHFRADSKVTAEGKTALQRLVSSSYSLVEENHDQLNHPEWFRLLRDAFLDALDQVEPSKALRMLPSNKEYEACGECSSHSRHAECLPRLTGTRDGLRIFFRWKDQRLCSLNVIPALTNAVKTSKSYPYIRNPFKIFGSSQKKEPTSAAFRMQFLGQLEAFDKVFERPVLRDAYVALKVLRLVCDVPEVDNVALKRVLLRLLESNRVPLDKDGQKALKKTFAMALKEQELMLPFMNKVDFDQYLNRDTQTNALRVRLYRAPNS